MFCGNGMTYEDALIVTQMLALSLYDRPMSRKCLTSRFHDAFNQPRAIALLI